MVYGGRLGTAILEANILDIDTLRADRLGCYGAERATSPRLDALAAEGVVYEEALAPTPWTLPPMVDSARISMTQSVEEIVSASVISTSRRMISWAWG